MPFGILLNIGEGFTATDEHFTTKTHPMAMETLGDDEAIDEPQQINIQKALRNQEELSEKDISEKSQLLKSQILFSKSCSQSFTY